MTIDPGDTADKEMERIARILCKADGTDPETLVSNYPPAQLKRGLYQMPSAASAWPAWKDYADLAHAAINALRPQTGIELVSADRPISYAHWIRDVKDVAYDLLHPTASRDTVDAAVKTLRALFQERVD